MRTKATHIRYHGFVIAITILLALSSSIFAQPPETRVLPYRFIYAPLDEIAKLADDEVRPMQRSQFVELTGLLNPKRPHAVSSGISITRAEYRATFDGKSLVDGTAVLSVQQRLEDLRYFPLDSLNLAIKEPTWSNPIRPAVLGSREDGQQYLRVERSDTLRFRWSLSPNADNADEFLFRMRLPDCPINRINLLLPIDLELSCDRGVISSATASASQRLWQIEAGGHTDLLVRFRVAGARQTDTYLRQVNTYNLAEEGVELITELQLDCDPTPIKELELKLSPGLRLTRVRKDEQTIPWTIASSGPNERTSVLLTFDPPLQGLNNTLSLTSFSNIPSESRLWSLPRLQASDVRWQQESARIRIFAPLELRELLLENASQLTSTISDTDTEAETTTIAFLNPNASVTVQVGATERRYEYSLATALNVDENEMTAEIAVGLRSLAADTFELAFSVGADWTINAVDADIVDFIHDWQVLDNETDSQRTLNINLREPIPAVEDAVLRIQAKRSTNATSRIFTTAELTPVRLPRLNARSRFLTVTAGDGLTVRYENDRRTTWLTRDDLTVSETSLLDTDEDTSIALLQGNDEELGLAFETTTEERRPFDAAIRIDVTLSPDDYQETFTIEIDRQTPPQPTLQVQFANPHPEGMRWFPANNPQRTLKSTQSENGTGVLWSIEWPEPGEDNLKIIGERDPIPMEGDISLPLVRVNNATTQTGTVHLAASPTLSLSLNYTDSLTVMPIVHDEFGIITNERLAFRYNPLADIFAGTQPVVSTTTRSLESLITVRHSELTAYLGQTNVIRCVYDLSIENLGTSEFAFSLPDNGVLRYVSMDGVRQPLPVSSGGQFMVAIPKNRRFSTVQIHYDETRKSPVFWRLIKLIPPKVPYTVFASKRQIWIPPGYALQNPGTAGRSAFGECMYHLCGPLLRTDDHRTFDPFSRESWSHLFQPTKSDEKLTTTANTWLEQFGNTEASNWQQLVQAKNAPQTDSKLWIDQERLAALSISPQQTVPTFSTSNSVAAGIQRLRSTGLVLIQSNNDILLTSMNYVASFRNTLRPSTPPVVYVLSTNDPQTDFSSVGAIPAEAWGEPVNVWRPANSQNNPYVAGGWHLQTWSDNSAHVAYRIDTFVTVACIAFLLQLTAVWWLRAHHIRVASSLILLSMMAALVLPVPLSWIGLGAFWGGLVGAFLTPAIATSSKPNESRAIATPNATATATVLGFIATIAISAASLLGQEPNELRADRGNGRIYEVFVPADENGNPDGDYLLVPNELRRSLLKATVDLRGDSNSWLLNSSVYRASLIPQTGSPEPQLESILARYQLYVPNAGPAVNFNLPVETIPLLAREARLNGRPIVLETNETGTAIRLPIRESGEHELEITFRRPAPLNQTAVDIEIPRAPNSVLFVSGPDDLTTFTSESSRGATYRDDTSGEIRVELGPTNRLAFRWGNNREAIQSPIEQLSWLRISPERVSWNVRLLLDTTRWPSDTLQVEVNERLLLDPIASDQPENVESSETEGKRTYTFPIQSDREVQLFNLDFVVAGRSGIGTVRLPYFKIPGMRPVPHDLAISFDPRLSVRPNPADDSERLQVSLFNSRWGEETTANLAYRIQGEYGDWSCSTTLNETTPSADLQVAYQLSRARTNVIVVASVTDAQQTRFQQNLQIPSNLDIDSVFQIINGEASELRWARNNQQEVTVFLQSRGPFQIAMLGHTSHDQVGTRELPRIQLLDCVINSEQLLVYRRSDVLLSAASTFDESPTIDPYLESRLAQSRLHAVINVASEETIPPIEVRANDKQLQAELVNVVSRENGIWQQSVNVRCQVEDGMLDAFHFELPSSWASRLSGPTGSVSIGKSPTQGMSRVEIWPPTPVNEILLSGAIPTTPGEPLSVPNIRLLEDGEIRRYLYLPTRVDGQIVQWTTKNLIPRPINEPAPPAVQTEAYNLYEISGPEFQAERLPLRTPVAEPRIHLAEIRVAMDGRYRFYGQAIFDLQPGGMNECGIKIPNELRIASVSVENVAVSTRLKNDLSVVKLASSDLPQRIVVLFEQKSLEQPQVVSKISAPSIIDPESPTEPVQVLNTMWIVQAPHSHPVKLSGIDQASLRTRSELELAQLQHLSEMIGITSQDATDFTREELNHWYAAWGERYYAALRRVQFNPSNATQATTNPIVSLLSDEHLNHVEALEVPERDTELANRIPFDAVDAWTTSHPNHAEGRSILVAGDLPSIAIQPASTGFSGFQLRLGLATLMGLVGFGIIARIRREHLENIRWLFAFGVLIGLFWWLWLQPSFFGWIIVLASLFAMHLLRSPSLRV